MTKRMHGMEYQWMGSGITGEQRAGIESMVRALRYYAKSPDPGFAIHALRLEGARRDHHAALGGMVPPMVKPPPRAG